MRYFKSLAFCLFLIVSASAALADYLDISVIQVCSDPNNCSFSPYINGPGSPAQGYAMFPPFTQSGSQLAFNFLTADPTAWGYNDYGYTAQFGSGGLFQMTGPADLTFLGEISDGYIGNNGGSSYIVLDFSGVWSNYRPATGTAEVLTRGDTFQLAELDVDTGWANSAVPEPATFALLGSAIAGAWATRKQFRI